MAIDNRVVLIDEINDVIVDALCNLTTDKLEKLHKRFVVDETVEMEIVFNNEAI